MINLICYLWMQTFSLYHLVRLNVLQYYEIDLKFSFLGQLFLQNIELMMYAKILIVHMVF